MTTKEEKRHDSICSVIEQELNSRNQWFAVGSEVPVHTKPSEEHRLRCVPDILTTNPSVAVYWECKGGSVYGGKRTSKYQARKWFKHMKQYYPHIKPYFVLFNPNHVDKPVIGKFRRYHASDVL